MLETALIAFSLVYDFASVMSERDDCEDAFEDLKGTECLGLLQGFDSICVYLFAVANDDVDSGGSPSRAKCDTIHGPRSDR